MRSCSIVVVVLISLLALMAGNCALLAQTPLRELPIDSQLKDHAVFMAWQGNVSVQRCGVCHYSPGNDFAKRDTDFCCLTELKQWLKSDKHAIARQRVEPIPASEHAQAAKQIQSDFARRGNPNIEVPKNWLSESNSLSFSICSQLGYNVQTDEGYAKFRENCLTCHGGYKAGQESNGFTQKDSNHPGISCNYCHQIDANDHWIDEHSGVEAKSKWRVLPPAAKAERGMRDLVSAEAQAKLCYSCHIGDADENLFVTHQMYAAGHPPLPSVELNTLIEAMPRHWRSQAELAKSLENDPQRAAYFDANFPALAAVAGDHARLKQMPWRIDTMVQGALASQQQWLRLIVQAGEPTSTHWGDYALYDCAACHHELRVKSARQAARSPGAPGRPRLLEWPQSLSRAAGLAGGHGQVLSTLTTELTLAVNKRPFGERATVVQAASLLDAELEKLKHHLTITRLSDTFIRDMLSALAETPDELLIDYHVARQVNWAVRCIDAEMDAVGKPLPQQVRTAISELGAGSDPAADHVSVDVPGGPDQPIYPRFVKAELERQAAYDSAQFSRQLHALSRSLSSQP